MGYGQKESKGRVWACITKRSRLRKHHQTKPNLKGVQNLGVSSAAPNHKNGRITRNLHEFLLRSKTLLRRYYSSFRGFAFLVLLFSHYHFHIITIGIIMISITGPSENRSRRSQFPQDLDLSGSRNLRPSSGTLFSNFDASYRFTYHIFHFAKIFLAAKLNNKIMHKLHYCYYYSYLLNMPIL